MARFLTSVRQHAAALRILIIFVIITGILYPLAVTAVADPGVEI